MNDTTTTILPVETRELSKTFRSGPNVVEALREVSMSVKPGEFLAIMGASGSGKSTLLYLLAGLTAPDHGEVVVEGRSLAGLSDAELTKFRRERIGLVFQSFNLVSTLTAEENIVLPVLTDRNKAVDQAGLESLLEQLDLKERRRHFPDALSGGEQQRVAIARALLMQPAIILADEPTGNLDSENGENICRILRNLCDEQGRSLIVVTHEKTVADHADRILTLKDGQFV